MWGQENTLGRRCADSISGDSPGATANQLPKRFPKKKSDASSSGSIEKKTAELEDEDAGEP